MATIKLHTGEVLELTQEELLNIFKLAHDEANKIDLNEITIEGVTYELSKESLTAGDYIVLKESGFHFVKAGVPYKVHNNVWTDGYTIVDDEGDNFSLDGEDYLTYKLKYSSRGYSFIKHGRDVNELKEGDIISYLDKKYVVVGVDSCTEYIIIVDGHMPVSIHKCTVALDTPVEKLLS
ncbi:hypothetical protein MFLO_15815 [Listeria floridensis FSL S10-1187]|uniref:Uncharacterized protein n=1 Tax=Listeria floridensis FSL S10-1187 TaxID=1265817 RepID=A0ABN0RB87_9LIST|nr:hypothetical protein [Listeria floridensis]EUJ23748.1 hypothetical protein MFLO_15815 [Listeria floridensis FSL S10-1187]